MKVFQINSSLNSGSTGRIAERIGARVLENGGNSFIAYGRMSNPSSSVPIKIGTKAGQAWHLFNTRAFDTHGFHSRLATKKLIQQIEHLNPDIIHLHNLHGYYLNVEVLFDFLKTARKPVVWTLHDCWAFTGHCCYYERVKCEKWKTECHKCPLKFLYPESYVFDNSRNNHRKKKSIFNSIENLNLVTVSKWLETQVMQSFLGHQPVRTIYNGVDLKIFRQKDQETLKEKYGLKGKKVVLGVANEWSDGKGLTLFLELSKLVSSQIHIVLVGLSAKQAMDVPQNVTAIQKTKDQEELSDYYGLADVFVTPSIAETFGLVVAEAMACGTPCVVNNSSALPELVDENVGIIVGQRTAQYYLEAIEMVVEKGRKSYENSCTSRAERFFGMETHLNNYLTLYQELLSR